MPDGLVVYRFGAFEFDSESCGLSSRAQSRDVTLPAPQAAILAYLLAHAGPPISKDALIQAGLAGRRRRREQPQPSSWYANNTSRRSALLHVFVMRVYSAPTELRLPQNATALRRSTLL